MDHFNVETIVVTPFVQNARIIADEHKRCAVIDPGGDVMRILDVISKHRYKVESVLLTHAHIDHAGGVMELMTMLAERQEMPLLCGHRADQSLRESIERQAMLFGLSPRSYQNCPEPNRYLEDGDEILIGALSGTVLFTPGHAPGHISFYFPGGAQISPGVVIAGDTVFAGGIGRTDLPGGDYSTLINSVNTKIMVLPEDTIIMPGHGENTTVGLERERNPFL